MKTLAPYGDVLLNRDSDYEIVIIFIGNHAIARAESFQTHLPFTLCLPPKSSPADFFWPISNCDVYIVDTGFSSDSFIRFCAFHFLGEGARSIVYISGKRLINFEKE